MKFFSKGSSLQKKIVLAYLLVSLLPIVLISTLAYAVYYHSVLKEAYALVEQNTRQHEIVVSQRLESYRSILYEIVTDSHVIKLTEQMNAQDEQEQIVTKSSLDAMMRNYVYTYDGIRSIAFLADDSGMVGYSKWYSSVSEVIWSNKEKRKEIYDRIHEADGLTWITSVNLSNSPFRKDYVVLVGFPVRNLHTKVQTGIMVLALDDNILNFDGKDARFDEAEREKTGVTTLIVDENEHIIAANQEEYKTGAYNRFIEEQFPKESRLHEWRQPVQGTGWQIVNVIDQDVYLGNIYMFTRIVIVLTVIISLMFAALMLVISRKYVSTIGRIARGIGAYAGTEGEETVVDVDDKDELYVIARQFQQMTHRVNALVETLKHKNGEIESAVNRQKHAEIKALEAQINPHFLFNTLDSINWRAIEHDEVEISDMLGALGSLLRYSVSNVDTMVVLEAEISWLRKYIFLQRDRFNYSFDCEYDIEEEALSFPIYKMLLQPIIENIILHAFEDVKEGGKIFVQAYIDEDERLFLRIRDNGCGMREEKLREIREEIDSGGPLNSDSIGISNVVNRLRIYYHYKAQMSVNSEYGKGTEFILVIPDVTGDAFQG